MLVTQAVEGEGLGQPSEPQHTPKTASPSNIEPIPNVPSSSQPQKTHKPVHEERGDSVERAATTAASLDAAHDSVVPGTKIPYWGLYRSNWFERVLDLEKIKDAQALEIQKLKTRVKKLEKVETVRNSTIKEGRNEFDQDEGTSFVQEDAETQGRYSHDADVTTASAPITTAGVSVKNNIEKSKEKSKEKAVVSETTTTRPTRGVVMREVSETASRPIVPPQQQLDLKDKGKGIMQEPKKPVKVKGKDQIAFDEEVARKLEAQLQAELEEEERLARQREEEANLISWDDTQAIMELKKKSYDEIQKLFHKEIKRVNTFMAMDSEVVEGSKSQAEGSKKRTRKELDDESVKRQKLKDDAKKAELKACLKIVPRDDEAVNVESLATKYPIVDWKTHILAEDKMLVKERFDDASPERYDRLLWGDLITVFEPSEEDEVWTAQQGYTLIRWRLYDSCGVHLLLMDTGICYSNAG
ncbi:hypothetical protein Tco_0073773 [Tanacetum coccineum]